MNKDNDRALREHVLYLLQGGGAHVGFEEAVEDFPAEFRGSKPKAIPHSAWELLEHMRTAQADILDFCMNPDYEPRNWPDDYWPEGKGPATDDEWNESLELFRVDAQAMQDLVADPAIDLFARIPHGEGQTILREALLLADHTSYHLGQLVQIRKVLGVWKVYV